MKITKKWLEEKSACSEGIDWFKDKKAEGIEGTLLVELLIKNKKLPWANWLDERLC